jgi:hypothetical protein
MPISAGSTLGLSWWWLAVPSNTSIDCPISWPSDLLDRWTDPGSGEDDERAHVLAAGQPTGVGAGCVCAGALLIALGTNLLRLSAGKERQKPAHKQCCYLLQLRWLLGTLLIGAGHAGTFVAFGFASAWLVSLLGLSALLWNLVLARLINSERPDGCLIFSLLCITAGLGAFTLFGSPAPVATWSASAINERWTAQVCLAPIHI